VEKLQARTEVVAEGKGRRRKYGARHNWQPGLFVSLLGPPSTSFTLNDCCLFLFGVAMRINFFSAAAGRLSRGCWALFG
jgi:hypothetical protein